MDCVAGLPALLVNRGLIGIGIARRLVAGTAALLLAASLGLSSTGPAASTPSGRSSPSCGSGLAADLHNLGDARQLVTVLVAGPGTTHALLQRWMRRAGGCFERIGQTMPALIGRSGVSTHHVEGDGTTPVGLFSFEMTMYGIEPNPGVRFAYHRLVCGDWWDEQSSSPLYNRFIHVPCGTVPGFAPVSEALWLIAPAYDWLAVIDYNSAPVVPGRGSGIFLHFSTGVPTVGCVALGVEDLIATLRWLDPGHHPRIAIGTASELASL